MPIWINAGPVYSRLLKADSIFSSRGGKTQEFLSHSWRK